MALNIPWGMAEVVEALAEKGIRRHIHQVHFQVGDTPHEFVEITTAARRATATVKVPSTIIFVWQATSARYKDDQAAEVTWPLLWCRVEAPGLLIAMPNDYVLCQNMIGTGAEPFVLGQPTIIEAGSEITWHLYNAGAADVHAAITMHGAAIEAAAA